VRIAAPMATFDATKDRILAALNELMSAPKGTDPAGPIRQAVRPSDPVVEEPAEEPAALSDVEKSTLELVMRMHMEERLAASKEPGQTIEAAGVPKLLDIAIALASAEIADFNTPFALLEDLFDAHVISVAESAFALVEARAAALAPFLAAEAKFQRCKLTLIRSCNELLRRLSKSKNTNFRGRVLMFMAYTFPLAERSGVNLKGVSAPSTVAIEEAPDDGGDDAMQVDGVDAQTAAAPSAAGGEGSGSGVVDFGFYATFWGLQQAFASPAASVAKDAWPGLVERMQTVLQVFGTLHHAQGPRPPTAHTTPSLLTPGPTPAQVSGTHHHAHGRTGHAQDAAVRPCGCHFWMGGWTAHLWQAHLPNSAARLA